MRLDDVDSAQEHLAHKPSLMPEGNSFDTTMLDEACISRIGCLSLDPSYLRRNHYSVDP